MAEMEKRHAAARVSLESALHAVADGERAALLQKIERALIREREEEDAAEAALQGVVEGVHNFGVFDGFESAARSCGRVASRQYLEGVMSEAERAVERPLWVTVSKRLKEAQQSHATLVRAAVARAAAARASQRKALAKQEAAICTQTVAAARACCDITWAAAPTAEARAKIQAAAAAES